MCERELQDAPSEAERSFFKSGTMAVMWCARACRFEALGTAAKLIHAFEKSTVQDLVVFQKTINVSKEAADVGTVFRPVHPAEVVLDMMLTDHTLRTVRFTVTEVVCPNNWEEGKNAREDGAETLGDHWCEITLQCSSSRSARQRPTSGYCCQ